MDTITVKVSDTHAIVGTRAQLEEYAAMNRALGDTAAQIGDTEMAESCERVTRALEDALRPVGRKVWTDAPEAYDYGWTRRTGRSAQLFGRTIHEVELPVDEIRAESQCQRYGSGLHAAFTPERLAEVGLKV